MKLGVMFPNLKNIEMNIEELDLPVRVYNFIKRGEIHTLQQLLGRNLADFAQIKCFKQTRQGNIDYILGMLKDRSEAKLPEG